MSDELRFPPGFLWGAATAAYQIEGGRDEDGKGESIWDRFVRRPGVIVDGTTGDVACDHYHRYAEDVEHMARMGLGSYRFSIAWSRIFPSGGGKPNQAGLDFYRRLVESLREKGIVPMATLYHWDLPQALEDRGGWVNRDTALRFAEYASTMFHALGDTVPLWATHNEPFIQAFYGYGNGGHAPGRRNPWAILPAGHHLLLSHGLAVDAFRAANLPGAQIGIVLIIWPHHPASSRPADVRAAQRADGAMQRIFLEPLFRGRYPEDMLRHLGRRLMRPPIRPGDMAIISRKIDFLGVNTYSRLNHVADWREPLIGARQLPSPGPATAMGWELYPDCIVEALQKARDYTDIPLYITENGAAFEDLVCPDGAINDVARVEYLRSHIAAARRALDLGIDLRGYFVWTLMDNFEWAKGTTARFGLIYTDYASQRRIWKRSADFFREVIAQNGL
ncbi:MAG: beta-glucosidase [Oscillochloris sp.]|nr:beta-glucosidase [Oscillochloris sp.]